MDPTESPEPRSGHEASDVSIRGIVGFGAGLGVATVLILAALFGLFRVLQVREARRVDVRVPPMVAASLRRTPPEPRLESNPLAPRLRMRAQEDAVLTSYGWIDRAGGVARIPIERAEELLVQRGLPPAKVATPVATPGTGKRETGNGKR
jgi:hypothetical protein